MLWVKQSRTEVEQGRFAASDTASEDGERTTLEGERHVANAAILQMVIPQSLHAVGNEWR